jgi:hypothetical protein
MVAGVASSWRRWTSGAIFCGNSASVRHHEARYFELDSDLGHSSSGPEHVKWVARLN